MIAKRTCFGAGLLAEAMRSHECVRHVVEIAGEILEVEKCIGDLL